MTIAGLDTTRPCSLHDIEDASYALAAIPRLLSGFVALEDLEFACLIWFWTPRVLWIFATLLDGNVS